MTKQFQICVVILNQKKELVDCTNHFAENIEEARKLCDSLCYNLKHEYRSCLWSVNLFFGDNRITTYTNDER